MDVWVVSQQYIKVMCILNEKNNNKKNIYIKKIVSPKHLVHFNLNPNGY